MKYARFVIIGIALLSGGAIGAGADLPLKTDELDQKIAVISLKGLSQNEATNLLMESRLLYNQRFSGDDLAIDSGYDNKNGKHGSIVFGKLSAEKLSEDDINLIKKTVNNHRDVQCWYLFWTRTSSYEVFGVCGQEMKMNPQE